MIDFTPWNSLLQTYVNDQGRVNYSTWKQSSSTELPQWLEYLASNPAVSECLNMQHRDRTVANTQLAVWLNLYNALTILQVLQQYPIASIQPKVLGLPNWIAFLKFFSRPVYSLNGRELSLNTIENSILRQQFIEPRIHFALVCASIGCPLLRNEAYAPDRVQSQLEEDAIRFINNPEKLRYDRPSNTLYCSKIFKWYGKDFLKVASSIPVYIQQYLSTSFKLSDETPMRYLPYDWNLNQRTSS